ncbi:MAG: hypothetical protein AAF637_03645 [Pseudomonadota bacterium]
MRKIARVAAVAFLTLCAAFLIAWSFLVFGPEDGGTLLTRFMLKPDDIIIEQRPDAAYEQLFPRYVELCATSQWNSKQNGPGGVTGHAVMYIKGACKDDDAAYPQLRRCKQAATSLDDPEHGAGVSVNRWFRNVNWVAIPGYKLFYEGNLEPDQPLTQAHFDDTVQHAIDVGVFDGVELHDYPTDAAERSLDDFVARRSIGTDFALRYGRTNSCMRLPVTEPMLDEVIAFLNDKNLEYALGEADYNWDLLADNCVHTLRNALAAANIWSPVTVRAVKLQRLFNLAVPANEFVNLARLGTEESFEDYRYVYGQDDRRDALQDFNWLPTRHGALLKTLPVHAPNEVFDTSFRLFTLQNPLRIGKTNDAIRLLSDERFVDLKTNLEYFADRYDAMLEESPDQVDGLASVRGDPYRRFGRLHRNYVEAQRDEVHDMLDRLAELTDSPEISGLER